MVLRGATDYANAQFDLTGNSGPFAPLEPWDDGELADENELLPPASFISVIQRADYGVINELDVITAGRQRLHEMRPEESQVSVSAEVASIGSAQYHIAHADGWSSLEFAGHGCRVSSGWIDNPSGHS